MRASIEQHTIPDKHVERVIAKTLHEKPREATHWSSRMMARATGLSQTGRDAYLAHFWSRAAS